MSRTEIAAALAAGKMVILSGRGLRKMARNLGATPVVSPMQLMLDEQMPASLPAPPISHRVPEGVLVATSNTAI